MLLLELGIVRLEVEEVTRFEAKRKPDHNILWAGTYGRGDAIIPIAQNCIKTGKKASEMLKMAFLRLNFFKILKFFKNFRATLRATFETIFYN